MLHDEGVEERLGGRVSVWFEPGPKLELMLPREDEREIGLGLVGENAMGLRGVAGNGRDREDVEAVLEPLPVPVPVPSPLELDPALSRNAARVGVTPSIPSPNSSSDGIGTRLSSLGLWDRVLEREVRGWVLVLNGRLLENGPSRMTRP